MNRGTLVLLLVVVTLVAPLLVGATPVAAQVYTTHRVQPGETLAKIGRLYCTTWQEVYRMNRDTIGPSPNALEPGMVLTIMSYCAAQPAQPPSGIYDRGPIAHAAGTFRSPYYTAAWGDTLYGIGRRFGVSTNLIREANGLQGNYIRAGVALLIPGASGSESVPPAASPGAAIPESERVYFGHGGISATRVGIISQGTAKRHILGGQAGRVMEIGTVSHGEPLAVTVTSVNGTVLALNGEKNKIRNNLWVRLPTTGDYVVTVAPVSPPENPQLAFDVTFIVQ